MANWLVGIVTCLYAATAIDYWIRRDFWTGVIWFGYALANIGFLKAMAR